MKVRYPSVAGTFYPAKASLLKELIRKSEVEVEEMVDAESAKATIIGGIVPHAGYIYCGREAVVFFKVLRKSEQSAETFIILHPDHYGVGSGVYTDVHDVWETPFGKLKVDRQFGDEMNLPSSSVSGGREHAAEVILPFLQYYMSYDFKILPIGMHDQRPETAERLSKAIFKAKKELKRKIILIASSDFSHYVYPEVGYRLDELVLDRIKNLDAPGLYRSVVEHNISVCGYGPIMTLLFYARQISNTPKVKILARGNSGKTGGGDLVVDYVSAVVYS